MSQTLQVNKMRLKKKIGQGGTAIKNSCKIWKFGRILEL
jgi:hypothetical protein